MEAEASLYRRPLPGSLVPFSSAEGRVLFREALDAGTLESFFPLIEQFHTQSEPAYCGLGSLVMSLNSLGIDPGRAWRGTWRWFSEELLDCCAPLEKVQKSGLSLEEVACLARCNGADVRLSRPDERGLAALRASVEAATRSTEQVVIVSYSRATLGQTGAGHFSPLGGYHRARDLALILDVARFKYPPHWVDLATLFAAMQEPDPTTQRARGWLVLKKRGSPSAIARFLFCPEGVGVKRILRQMLLDQVAQVQAEPPVSLAALLALTARVVAAHDMASHVQFRVPRSPEQLRLLEELSLAFQETQLYREAALHLEPAQLTRVLLWLLAAPRSVWRNLPISLAVELEQLLESTSLAAPLRAELGLLHSQVEFLLEHAQGGVASGAVGTPIGA
jgi:glutathione gamma-glutamylcysteinyltransferase